MADKKKYIDLAGLTEYDKGVKDALNKKASTGHNHDTEYAAKDHDHGNKYAAKEHDHEAITTEEIRNIFANSNYEDGDTGSY